MIDELLQIVAPHHCYGCGQTGHALCDNCKYDIIDEGFERCIVCAAPSSEGICSKCRTNYQKAWCVGERTDALRKCIDAFKFERERIVYKPLGDLLHQRLPVLPSNTVVVPVPTIASHIRQRGYDHTRLIAKYFAKQRALEFAEPLKRTSKLKQLGASRSRRFAQAKNAFTSDEVLKDVPYLLVDDIVTTNATLRYASQALRDAGASQVWVGVLARQSLEKKKSVS